MSADNGGGGIAADQAAAVEGEEALNKFLQTDAAKQSEAAPVPEQNADKANDAPAEEQTSETPEEETQPTSAEKSDGVSDVKETKSDSTSDVKEVPPLAETSTAKPETTAVEVLKPPLAVQPRGKLEANTNYPWQELNQMQATPHCKKCLMPVDVTKAVQKNKGEAKNNLVCRHCNNATTMLSRNLGWPLPDFPSLSPDSQMNFWRKCSEIIQENGRLDYHHLRAHLAMTLTERSMETSTLDFNEEFLPMGVWLQRGFDKESILKGETEEHPILGTTYAVNLKRKNKSYQKQRVEEMLTKFEAQARQKRKAPSSGSQASTQAARIEELLEDDDNKPILALMHQSPTKPKPDENSEPQDPQPDVAGQDPKTGTSNAKSRRKELSDINKHNNNLKKFCGSCIDKFTPQMGKLQTLLVNAPMLPSGLVEDLQSTKTHLSQAMAECEHLTKKVIAEGERLPDLSFDRNQFQEAFKDLKSQIANGEKLLKVVTAATTPSNKRQRAS